jgi:hypothetical protein
MWEKPQESDFGFTKKEHDHGRLKIKKSFGSQQTV